MNTKKELKWHELKTSYQPSDFSFQLINELVDDGGMIGQESALEAFEMGLKIKAQGYNIYVCEQEGDVFENILKTFLEKRAKTFNTPDDLCYVYNFRKPEEPQLIALKPGDGERFKEDMDEFVQFIINELPMELESKASRKKRELLLEELDKAREKLILELSELAESIKISIKHTETGIGFAPLNNQGEVISKEEYSALDESEKEELDERLESLYDYADELGERMGELEKQYEALLRDINEEIVLSYIGGMIKHLQMKYSQYRPILNYLNEIAAHILEHIKSFESSESDKNSELKSLIPLLDENDITKLTQKYTVNLITSHAPGAGAPVIVDDIGSEFNLCGKMLLDTERNMMHTDFTYIRSGLLHKAQGGYLIIHLTRLLENPTAWPQLKCVLKSGNLSIPTLSEMNIALVREVEPEPLKNNVKVILIGSEEMYEALYAYDRDFRNLFKLKIQFEDKVENSKKHVEKIGAYINRVCKKEEMPVVTLDGLLEVVSYGNRLVESANKLPTNVEQLLDLVREASSFAEHTIDRSCIKKAIALRKSTGIKLEQRIDEKIMDGTFLIDTKGAKIGQVNGLAVYQLGSHMFGRPVKITVTTYRGKAGIIDIENEAKLSGAIHTKGIHIITGFLGNQFAQKMPLSLSCSICFEQSYGKVDGDSASSTELYAILSSLAEVPIKQNIAVTGSVNQFGEIQPIGGVNEKIEGFFKICMKRGLEGDEGVIIPWQNQKDLLLSEEVIEAVKENLFHIYVVQNIWEGMEVITGKDQGEVKGKVMRKLEQFNA